MLVQLLVSKDYTSLPYYTKLRMYINSELLGQKIPYLINLNFVLALIFVTLNLCMILIR